MTSAGEQLVMKRRLGMLLAVVLVLRGGSIVAAAASSPGHLIIAGSKTASVSWTLRSTVHLDTRRWFLGLPVGTVKRGGRLGGVVIRRGEDVMLALVDDRDLGDPLVFGVDDPVLAPGRYTVTLLADGPTSVSLPLGGSASSYHLRPMGQSSLARVSVSALPNAHLPVVYAAAPVTVTKHSLVVIAAHVSTSARQVETNDLCLSTQDEPCAAVAVDGSGSDFNGQSAGVGSTGDGTSTSALFFYPGDVRPGKYYAGVDQVTVGLVRDARLVVLTVQFG